MNERGLAMRHLISFALILCFVAVLMYGFLNLARELLTRNFFGAPSLPSALPEQTRASGTQESESHSATPLS
jgi:hypothetical protein